MCQHRLAGPGFARDRVQTRLEAQLGALDQEQVLNPQLVQHAARFSAGRRRIRSGYAAGTGSAACSTPPSAGAAAGMPTMSRPRTSSQAEAAPAIATAAPTSRISLRPLMNAWLAATVACSRSCGGTAVSALCVAPEDDRVREARRSVGQQLAELRVDPGLEDRAERRGAGGDPDLAEGAVDARGHPGTGGGDDPERDRGDPGVGHADPDPGEDEPGQQRRPAAVEADPGHQREADPDEDHPGCP